MVQSGNSAPKLHLSSFYFSDHFPPTGSVLPLTYILSNVSPMLQLASPRVPVLFHFQPMLTASEGEQPELGAAFQVSAQTASGQRC